MTDSNSFSLGTKALGQGHPGHPNKAAGLGQPQRQSLEVAGCSVHPPPLHSAGRELKDGS